MKYGKRWSILERWEADSAFLAGKEPKPNLVNRPTGKTISWDVIDFAEDFLQLTVEDVQNLSSEKLQAIVDLERVFGELSDKVLEAICKDGLGESFKEMCANEVAGVIVPKPVRECVERDLDCKWEEDGYALIQDLYDYFIYEAYEEKYWSLYSDDFYRGGWRTTPLKGTLFK